MKYFVVGFGLVVGLAVVSPRTALAADAREPAPAELDRPSQRSPRAGDEPEGFKQLAVEFNPLSLIIGRYSAQVEYLPVLHHGFVLNPHYDSVSFELTVSAAGEEYTYEEGFSGFGGEIGYRYYTGRNGPNGFFIGPSFLVGRYSTKGSELEEWDQKSFTSLGWAVDLGGQGVIGPGIVLGIGVGMQQTKNSINADQFGELPLSAEILVGSGVRPRFLLALGYAFD